VDDLLDKEIRDAGTTAFGQLKRSPQVDNICGIPIIAIVVVVADVILKSVARYLKG